MKKLQDYLVSLGYMTQSQVNTGYGTYGPQTTAAVAALQKSLGVDNSTGIGYWGPRTITAVTSMPKTATATATATATKTNAELDSILSNPNLTADQKAIINSIYGAVTQNDKSSAEKITAAMSAASKYSDPYFKAQVRLATDALDRGLSAKEGDLHYDEGKLGRALRELRDNTDASKDQLSFEHSKELADLGKKYEQDLTTTRDNLAAAGFGSSSRRARAETILADNNSGLVESANKNFGYRIGNLDRTLGYSEENTTADIANLRRLTQEGKLDLYRSAENTVGSKNLPNVSGLSALGDITGEIPYAQQKDKLSFASNFVF